MTDFDCAPDNWHMACCLLGNCYFRIALRGEETTAPALLAELKKLEAVFSGLPGGEYLPLRLAIEQVVMAVAD
ncbi:hypothetical protein [Candidatus Erwinia dacicola]|uniref:Uncharacterized protein n=1 Tax=Candidatus Erwinia dacicola TaxID=252393 RepID=A0A1E7YV75_9GAMM|nr:hypothetical protein [Candidatus Erwinia dacicola]OFC58739.1 hypothetical protein BBW68_02775 [Candidatus Erwinia dacicola]RAP70459.1 hypothetical protein ACZ87_02739 [Candidatus Erwinia dacicola]